MMATATISNTITTPTVKLRRLNETERDRILDSAWTSFASDSEGPAACGSASPLESDPWAAASAGTASVATAPGSDVSVSRPSDAFIVISHLSSNCVPTEHVITCPASRRDTQRYGPVGRHGLKEVV